MDGLRNELRLGAAFMQIPMGLEEHYTGLVDIISREAVHFLGEKGTEIKRFPVPEEYKDKCEETRRELVERLAELDEEIGELFLNEIEPEPEQIIAAVRRQTIARKFVPVFMGSAYKNKGVQLLLDGVISYLPSPAEVTNVALDLNKNEAEVQLACESNLPLVALAFKLEESRYGQLTYVRVYQGMVKKGMMVTNTKSKKKTKIPRLVRMHSNEMEDVEFAKGFYCCFRLLC